MALRSRQIALGVAALAVLAVLVVLVVIFATPSSGKAQPSAGNTDSVDPTGLTLSAVLDQITAGGNTAGSWTTPAGSTYGLVTTSGNPVAATALAPPSATLGAALDACQATNMVAVQTQCWGVTPQSDGWYASEQSAQSSAPQQGSQQQFIYQFTGSPFLPIDAVLSQVLAQYSAPAPTKPVTWGKGSTFGFGLTPGTAHTALTPAPLPGVTAASTLNDAMDACAVLNALADQVVCYGVVAQADGWYGATAVASGQATSDYLLTEQTKMANYMQPPSAALASLIIAGAAQDDPTTAPLIAKNFTTDSGVTYTAGLCVPGGQLITMSTTLGDAVSDCSNTPGCLGVYPPGGNTWMWQQCTGTGGQAGAFILA